jgi:outer membrane protein assembly factor BamD (BamD/ComL family)
MAAFADGGLRLGVLIADMSYVNQDEKAAEEAYRALLADRERPLNTPQKAYVTFALIRSLDLQFKDREVGPLAETFVASFGTTPTMPRFLLWRANLRTSNLPKSRPGMPEWESGMADYAELVRSFPKTEEADYACYYMGWSLWVAGEFGGAVKCFETYRRLYPNGIWKERAEPSLAACRERIPVQ